jgi:hypothetical protein
MTPLAALLLADVPWEKVIIPIVMVIVYGINYFLGQVKRSQMQGGPPKPAGAPKPARQELNEELNEFLRRATQRRGEGSGAAEAAQRAAEQARTPPVRRRKKPVVEVVEVQDAADEPLRNRPRVASALEKRTIEDPARPLTQLGRVEDSLQSRMRESFDHQIGQLAGPATAAAAPPEPRDEALAATAPPSLSVSAGDIAGMFANPQSVGQALILGEILSRPVHRW